MAELFFYETKHKARLDKKRMVIEAYQYSVVGTNDYLGTCMVDLHTLANGPVSHDLQLRDVRTIIYFFSTTFITFTRVQGLWVD